MFLRSMQLDCNYGYVLIPDFNVHNSGYFSRTNSYNTYPRNALYRRVPSEDQLCEI